VDYDDDEFLSAWTRHGQNWSRICWATYQHPAMQPIFNRQPLIWSIRWEWQDVVSRGLFRTNMPFPSVEQSQTRSCPACPSLVTGMISGVGCNVVVVMGSARSEG